VDQELISLEDKLSEEQLKYLNGARAYEELQDALMMVRTELRQRE
jgi:hypothetical protein